MLECIGLFLFSFIQANTTYIQLVPAFIILGAGIGLAIAQNTQVILSEIPREGTGSASGVLNTIRQVGSALGIAVIGAVLSAQIVSNVTTNINHISGLPQSQKNAIISKAGDGGISYSNTTPATNTAAIPLQIASNPVLRAAFIAKEKTVGNQIKSAVNDSLASSIGVSIRVGAIFVSIGALLSLLIPNIHHKKEEKEQIATAEIG